MRSYPSRISLAVFTLSTCALLAALVTQHVFDMQPCPWCIAQRVVFLFMAAATLPGFWALRWAKPGLAAASALALLGAGLALWQHFVAAKSSSCAFSLPDRWLASSGLDRAVPWLLEPRASCADAAVLLLGVPYEAWSFALFTVLAGWSVKALRR